MNIIETISKFLENHTETEFKEIINNYKKDCMKKIKDNDPEYMALCRKHWEESKNKV